MSELIKKEDPMLVLLRETKLCASLALETKQQFSFVCGFVVDCEGRSG